jgi:Asp-tRNA(Asn)/Glu-tRNA(Gln) amidotransferase A subunit family amidase
MNDYNGTSRREFIAWGVALASGVTACSKADNNTSINMTKPLTDLGATEAIAAMRQGDMSAVDYAAALLQRCETGKHLNAFITLEPECVLEAATAADELRATGAELGPLHDLPIPVKDSVNTKTYRTTGGTRALSNFYPEKNAVLVDQLIAAGAIVMGKTTVHDLSFGWTSNNQAFGAVHNPYDTSRIPGGSSGGTAAAIASGMAPLGIAEDTQGSIRVPAAMCGIYGFRPTTNRYPNTGVVPITPLFDQVGPHARAMADIALFDHVINGEPLVSKPSSLQGVRLGVPRRFFFESLDTEVERVSNESLKKLAAAGAILVEADVPRLAELIALTTAQVQLYHVMPMLTQYLQEYNTGVTFDELMQQASPDIQATFARYVLPGGELVIPEADFIAARDQHLPALRKTLKDYFAVNNLAAMIFPTAQIAAPPIGQDSETLLNGKTVPFEAVISRNISPGSTAGLPGLVIPADLNSDGLPVALEIDGPEGSDRELLGIGLAIEHILGHLPPPNDWLRKSE